MGRARCVFLLLLSFCLLPGAADAQQRAGAGSGEDPERGFQLQQNYPNPFSQDTRIPFELRDDAFVDGRPAVVSMRIYNVLRHYVASPRPLNHPAGDGAAVLDLEYGAPGRYEAQWDGRNRSGSLVPSGVYILELSVNGRTQVMRMFVSR